MLSCMEDSAHDKEHIYHVLYNALEIAKTEMNIDYDVLIASCLLHDIGRKEQFENPAFWWQDIFNILSLFLFLIRAIFIKIILLRYVILNRERSVIYEQ